MNMKAVFIKYAGDEEDPHRIGVADSEEDAIEAVKYHIKGVDDDEYTFEVQRKVGGFYVILERVP